MDLPSIYHTYSPRLDLWTCECDTRRLREATWRVREILCLSPPIPQWASKAIWNEGPVAISMHTVSSYSMILN